MKKKSPDQVAIDTTKFIEHLKHKYLAHTFTAHQKFSVKFDEWNFMITIKSVLVVGKSKSGKIESDEFATLNSDTELMFEASYDSNIQLSETGATPDHDKRNVSAIILAFNIKCCNSITLIYTMQIWVTIVAQYWPLLVNQSRIFWSWSMGSWWLKVRPEVCYL